MNIKSLFITTTLISLTCVADTTIDQNNPYGYGANIGWINTYAEGTNGAIIGQSYCSGYIFGVNVGWIHLGNGSPVNNIQYSNLSDTDYGINHDGIGNLTGYAYGANIGWINFDQIYGKPKVDLATGDLSGYAWGANVGWINLDGIKTLSLDSGIDGDFDGIPDAWEFGHTNTLLVLSDGNKDSDGDGVPDSSEYLSDTDPLDENDFFKITDLVVLGSTNIISWPSKPSRLYNLQYATALTNTIYWIDYGFAFIPEGLEVTKEVLGVGDSNRFYRVEASPPLQ